MRQQRLKFSMSLPKCCMRTISLWYGVRMCKIICYLRPFVVMIFVQKFKPPIHLLTFPIIQSNHTIHLTNTSNSHRNHKSSPGPRNPPPSSAKVAILLHPLLLPPQIIDQKKTSLYSSRPSFLQTHLKGTTPQHPTPNSIANTHLVWLPYPQTPSSPTTQSHQQGSSQQTQPPIHQVLTYSPFQRQHNRRTPRPKSQRRAIRPVRQLSLPGLLVHGTAYPEPKIEGICVF